MKKMSTVELQIAERARKFKGEALHNLHHFIDAPLLQESYKKLNKKSAKGIDGKTWLQYGLEFPERRESLLAEFKSGRYRAPALRRVYIPKDKHSQRPIDIATTEDKVLQESVRRAIVNISKYIKLNRHMKLRDLIAAINIKLRGHYSYYGITFNSKGILLFYEQVKRSLFKWLNRRGGKRNWKWETFIQLVNSWNPLIIPLIAHFYVPSVRN